MNAHQRSCCSLISIQLSNWYIVHRLPGTVLVAFFLFFVTPASSANQRHYSHTARVFLFFFFGGVAESLARRRCVGWLGLAAREGSRFFDGSSVIGLLHDRGCVFPVWLGDPTHEERYRSGEKGSWQKKNDATTNKRYLAR